MHILYKFIRYIIYIMTIYGKIMQITDFMSVSKSVFIMQIKFNLELTYIL